MNQFVRMYTYIFLHKHNLIKNKRNVNLGLKPFVVFVESSTFKEVVGVLTLVVAGGAWSLHHLPTNSIHLSLSSTFYLIPYVKLFNVVQQEKVLALVLILILISLYKEVIFYNLSQKSLWRKLNKHLCRPYTNNKELGKTNKRGSFLERERDWVDWRGDFRERERGKGVMEIMNKINDFQNFWKERPGICRVVLAPPSLSLYFNVFSL